jgi:FixJ family two-component response regulator
VAVEALQHGAFDFIEKPFHDHDLLERVHAPARTARKNEPYSYGTLMAAIYSSEWKRVATTRDAWYRHHATCD